ncbi:MULTISPECIES: putative RNA methyltransferase [Aeromonas]|uniref:Methyltransferase domain-containing protein n=1 Tax=Aeromonas rivipollensis TaxID=948519 RepID=A0AAW9YD88_9GAMM|nr:MULTISPECIES: methyltransferase domain-containing protein [Aeromonas]AVP93213.1 SAM-dependent methyltransferase [Aeromonas rivipollensis]MCE9922910.1 methyltransferase domain-containing protein [Aeromonas media]MDM5123752.1 methyltransferase domain-containing protein [Aeromonas rivipollensis]NEX75724.1 methyltransferase domain-containing protein [Aeromonas rivipollensis]NEX89314.1 methyltransferase domain-containing protein [Aeromonas rivipollensis]
MQLQCPLCRSPLHLHEASRGVYCDNKHHFDPAPEGYLDLIPGKKDPKDSDSRALLRAKRRFLEQGHQLPLVEAMATLLAPLGERELIHLGCGEGYYCRALAERLPGWQFGGLDLAKNAIFAANKAQPDGHFVIADPAKAPLLAGSAQVLLVNDLKIKTELLVSLLTPGGYLLHLQPGPRHQWQLRVSLNPVSMEHPLSWPALAGLVPVERQRCQFSMTMDQSLRAHVLETSRLGWRAGGEQRHAFTQQGPDELEQDLLLSLWQKPL